MGYRLFQKPAEVPISDVRNKKEGNFPSFKNIKIVENNKKSLNNTHMEELMLCSIQYKIHWNKKWAASDVFYITQSIKFF